MKIKLRQAFTLVELLVVITILAIISVVAYQNFWWAIWKAVSARKISDVATIEKSLQQYKVEKNYYPMVSEYNGETNMWWYNSSETARASNSIEIWERNGSEITSIEVSSGWWKILWLWAWDRKQIWAKWVMTQDVLWKTYLTKDLYDPELWDIKVWSNKMIDYWVGRYVYSVFRKPLSWDWDSWDRNREWTYFNIAYTILKEGSDTYITKIVWDYDAESCFEDKDKCPETLIGSWDNILKDNEENNVSSLTADNQGVPYQVSF